VDSWVLGERLVNARFKIDEIRGKTLVRELDRRWIQFGGTPA